MNWTPEQIEAIRTRNLAGETLDAIGQTLSPPLSRQRLSALLNRKPKERKPKRVAVTISFMPDRYEWLIRTTAGGKKSVVIQGLVDKEMEIETRTGEEPEVAG